MLFFIYGYEGEDENNNNPDPSEESNGDKVLSITQEELNRINKKERLRAQAAEKELKDVKDLLQQLQRQQDMNETEKEELAQKLEEFEQAKMSEQERREHEFNKLKKSHEEEKSNLSKKLEEITRSKNELVITRAIKDSAMSGKITAFDGTGDQVLAVLKGQAIVNEDDEVIIKNFTWTDEGKTFTEDLPVNEVISKMKESEHWANFWKDPSKKGYFDSPSNKIIPGNSKFKSHKEYMKAREKGQLDWQRK